MTDTTTPADERPLRLRAEAAAMLLEARYGDDYPPAKVMRELISASQPAQEPIEQSIFDADNMALYADDEAVRLLREAALELPYTLKVRADIDAYLAKAQR